MKRISLTQDKFALVDDENYEWLRQYTWHVEIHGYLCYASTSRAKNKRPINLMMHRLILGLQYKDGKQTDHIDGNGLNNQRSNLRICNHTQNQHNQRRWGATTSKFKGVSWSRVAKKWVVHIRVNRKKFYLGCFDNEVEAAEAYNEAAIKYFGEFALLNELQ